MYSCSEVGNPIFSTRFLTDSGIRPRWLLRRSTLFQPPSILRSPGSRNASETNR